MTPGCRSHDPHDAPSPGSRSIFLFFPFSSNCKQILVTAGDSGFYVLGTRGCWAQGRGSCGVLVRPLQELQQLSTLPPPEGIFPGGFPFLLCKLAGSFPGLGWNGDFVTSGREGRCRFPPLLQVGLIQSGVDVM